MHARRHICSVETLNVGMMFDVYALEIMLMMKTGGAVAKSTPKGGGAF